MKLHTLWVADHVAFSTLEHVHDYYQIVYCQKAGGTVEIDGIVYEAVPGTMYFIQPMQPHAMRRGKNVRVIEVKFLAEDEETARLLKNIPSVVPLPEGHIYRRGIKDVVREGLSGAMFCNETTNAALQLLLCRLLRMYMPDEREALHTLDFDFTVRNTASSSRNNDVEFIRLIDYMEQHMADKITLEKLARLIHFNKSYLIEQFKEAMGVPPMKYLNEMRMEKAKELLITTEKSITDVATETGFQSIHYFSRTFKKKENMTPHDYRVKYAEVIAPDQLI